MSVPTAVIAEDEAHLRDELTDTLAEVWPELVITAAASDGAEACEAIERDRPDILFLDIQMPGMTGLDVARYAGGRCRVVFVTAFDKYAVEAFAQAAVDYVLKPVTAERLAETVRRLKSGTTPPPAQFDALLQALEERLTPPREFLRWIAVPEKEELRLVTLDEVCYFQSDHKYTRLVTADRQSLIRRTLKELADELDPRAFWQIHRSTLVNVAAIAGVLHDVNGHLRVRLKKRPETLPVSEPYVHRFRHL